MTYKPDFALIIPIVKQILKNNSGSSIDSVVPVFVNTSGDMVPVDVSNETKSLNIAGVTVSAIISGQSGDITSSGKIENISLGFGFAPGDVIWVSKTVGGLTNVPPSLVTDGGAFASGDYIIKVGVVAKNQSNPAQQDLLVNIQVIGQI